MNPEILLWHQLGLLPAPLHHAVGIPTFNGISPWKVLVLVQVTTGPCTPSTPTRAIPGSVAARARCWRAECGRQAWRGGLEWFWPTRSQWICCTSRCLGGFSVPENHGGTAETLGGLSQKTGRNIRCVWSCFAFLGIFHTVVLRFFSKCSQVFAIAHMIFSTCSYFLLQMSLDFTHRFFHFITFHPPFFRQGSLHHRRAAGWRTGRYSRRSSGRWSGSTAAALAGRGPWTEKKDLFLQCLGGEMWWGFFLLFFLDYNYKWWWLILMNGIFNGFHLGGFLSHGPKTHWFQYFR